MWQIIHVTQINDQRCGNKWHPNAGERERRSLNVRSQVVWPILLQNSGKKVISSSTTLRSFSLTVLNLNAGHLKGPPWWYQGSSLSRLNICNNHKLLVVIAYIQPLIGRISTDIYFECMGSEHQIKSVFFTGLIMSTFDVFRQFYYYQGRHRDTVCLTCTFSQYVWLHVSFAMCLGIYCTLPPWSCWCSMLFGRVTIAIYTIIMLLPWLNFYIHEICWDCT